MTGDGDLKINGANLAEAPTDNYIYECWGRSSIG
jgi:hypothetical protein